LGFQSFQDGSPKTDFWLNENPEENPDEKLFSLLEKWSSSIESLMFYQVVSFKECLHRMIERKPEMVAKVAQLTGKLTDLSLVFTEMYFYHPAMKGNFDLSNVARKLTVSDFPKIPSINSDVLAVNEFLKYSTSDTLFEKNLIVEEILNYGRFQLANIEKVYRFLKAVLINEPE
jgi:hypothetical protein